MTTLSTSRRKRSRDHLALSSGSSVARASSTVATVARMEVPVQMMACDPGTLPRDHVAVRRPADTLLAVAVSSRSSSRRSNQSSVCSAVVLLANPLANVQMLVQPWQVGAASSPAPPDLPCRGPDRDKADRKESVTSSSFF